MCDGSDREASLATPREGARLSPLLRAGAQEQAAAELARQQASQEQEEAAAELARQRATEGAEAARQQAAKEQVEADAELARQVAAGDAEAARQKAAKEQEEADAELARQRATEGAEAARAVAEVAAAPKTSAGKRKGRASSPEVTATPTATTLAQGMRATIGHKKPRQPKAAQAGSEAAEAGEQEQEPKAAQAGSEAAVAGGGAALPAREATTPAEAPAMPESENGRVMYKGGTITRKSNMFKVHIPKKFSREGKECDVQKKFTGKTSDVQAFDAAKTYIDHRTQ